MHECSAVRDRKASRVLLLGASIALGVGGCLGEGRDADDESNVGTGTASLEGIDDEIEDECTAADVTWANPADETQACAGPWTYYKYASETSRSPLCGASDGCIQYSSCPHWVQQPAAKPSEDYDVNMICHGPPGEVECEPNWTLATSVCDTFKAEQSAVVDAPQDQQVTGSSSILTKISTTPSTRRNRFRCDLTIEYQKLITSPHSSCACAIPQYPSCLHAVQVTPPPVRVVTAAGQSKSQVRAAHVDLLPGQLSGAQIQPSCTTGEDQPSLPAKLDRLFAGMADSAIVTPGTAVFGEFVRRAKLTYELFDGAAVAAPEEVHAAVLDLYRTYPDLEPTCGRNAEAVADPCDDETSWRLRFCTRMSSLHVGGDLARRIYQECIDELAALGDAIEGDDCDEDDPFVTASVDPHRRLQEKVLVRFGTALVAPGTNKVDDSADALHLVDRWYAQAARVFPAETAGAELALVSNKFWQAAYGYRVDSEAVGWIDQSLYGNLQQKLHEAEGKSADDARQIVDAAMEVTELQGLELDRAVLTAAYADAAPGQPVLAGAPLLRVTADALAPLAERMDALVQFHDVGCSLLDCAALSTPTKLSRLWKVLAHLSAGPGSSPTLAEVLAATPGTMAGWKPVFLAIQAEQQRLLDALAEEDADGEGDLRAVVSEARARIASYEATGLFLPAVGDRLYTGVHANQRDRVRDGLEQLEQIMNDKRRDIDNRLVSLVDGLVRVRDADTSLAQLEATKERLIIERDDAAARAASFRAILNSGGAGSDSSVFELLMAEWAAIEGSIDEQAYLRVDDSADLFLTGDDATFESWQGATLTDLGVHKIEVARKETISIATDGAWAPTCALREARVLDVTNGPPSVNGAPIDLTGPPIGPEGYTISWTGSNMIAESAHGGKTDRFTMGFRAEGCVSTPGMSVTGDGARFCAYIDGSVNREEGTSWQNGFEGRTSTQFSSGIFLPTTPFEAPAGSLVVVEMPPGQTDPAALRDVHLVRGPHTTIAVDGPADLYLVVNDRTCGSKDTLNQLHVTIRKYIGVGDAARSLLTRMSHATSIIRARIPDLMARGEVLPAETTEMELAAKLDAIDVPGEIQVAVDDYPAPMRDLFYKYIAREMTRLEASVRIANLDREIRIKDAEFRATEVAVQNSAMDGYLVSLLPRWTVRGLRLKELRDVSSMYATDVRYFLSPLLRLWYPQVREGLGDVDAVEQLANVDVDQPVLAMTDQLLALGTALATRIEDAETPYPSPEDTAPSFVALRFPNPEVLDPECDDSPSARCRRTSESVAYRWATVAQSKALWDAIGEPTDGKTSRHLVFELSPDDLYAVSGGSEYLSCSKSLPVVRRIGLGLTGFPANGLPGDERAVEGSIPATAPMGFVDATGVKSFEMANPSWRNLANVPLVYGASDYAELRSDFLAMPQDVRGVSPFTTFVFDIPEALVAAWNLRTAKTVDVLLEVEAVRGNAGVAVPSCTAAP